MDKSSSSEEKIIKSVSDAIDIALECSRKNFWRQDENEQGKDGSEHEIKFGIWYRGEPKKYMINDWDTTLIPSVFREKYDEASIFYHFQLLSPDFRHEHRSNFEWLCLMQHYGVPTRLLDWTERVLVALYFAVDKHGCDDGYLFVLNPRLLNEFSDIPRALEPRISIHTPHSFNTVLRAEMAAKENLHEIFLSKELENADLIDAPKNSVLEKLKELCLSKKNKKFMDLINLVNQNNNNNNNNNDDDDDGDDGEKKVIIDLLEKMREPVAVFPYRTNDRLKVQQGVFTLHGGKAFSAEKEKPIGFKELEQQFFNASKKFFLRKYKVAYGSKQQIKKELKAAGLEKAKLYPELDKQSEYLKEIWKRHRN